MALGDLLWVSFTLWEEAIFSVKPLSFRAMIINLFKSHGSCKLIANILQHPKRYIFYRFDKKIGII